MKIKDLVKLPFYRKSDGNYKSLEKYIECEHKKANTAFSRCKECDIAWLIERCRVLEKTIDEIGEITVRVREDSK